LLNDFNCLLGGRGKRRDDGEIVSESDSDAETKVATKAREKKSK
jgi:hypothetical protein